jgi:hypothetical protein
MTWIDVKERLPDAKHESYLILFERNYITGRPFKTKYRCKVVKWEEHIRNGKTIKWKWRCGAIPKVKYIRYWMPIPAMPD